MKHGRLLAIVATLVITGCAHMDSSHQRGSIVVLDSDKEGHACLGGREVSVGDRLKFFRTECVQDLTGEGVKAARVKKVCKKILVGNGSVQEVTDEHFSVVKLEGEGKLERGFIVEKVRN